MWVKDDRSSGGRPSRSTRFPSRQNRPRACRAWQTSEPTRCALYDRGELDRYLGALRRRAVANHGTAAMDFCMDRYEFPNQNGENPWIAVNWYDANLICEQQGKRLCTEPEWNFACEGEQTRPYPYEQYEARRGPGNGGCNVGAYPSVEGPSSSVYLSLQASHSALGAARSAGAPPTHFLPASSGTAPLGVEEAASSAGALGDPVCQNLVRLAQEIRDRQQIRENEAASRASRVPRMIPVPPLRTLLGRFAQSDANYGKVVACLWNARPSGDSPACQSQAGAYDLTGNVDEWVATRGAASKIAALRGEWRARGRGDESAVPGRVIQRLQAEFPSNRHPYPSPLKGGWWGPVRNRCRPSTTAHGPYV
jgi:formylglycine-generating enzyme required for sulfatase activity